MDIILSEPRHSRWRLVRLPSATSSLLLLLAAVLAVLLPASPGRAMVDGKELKVTYDDDVTAPLNMGRADLDVELLTANGGAVVGATGPNGTPAARLPTYQEGATPPLAVYRVTDVSGEDDLRPGRHTLDFGARFNLDAANEGPLPDNGNNLLQRGLATTDTQYKLEVDDWHAACLVKGDGGTVRVHSDMVVTPDTWYAVRCTRSGRAVTLVLKDLATGDRWTATRRGRIGAIRPKATLPLSIGGKLTPRGDLWLKDSDQFNGRVDTPFVNIHD